MVAIIWNNWYPYHAARLRALADPKILGQGVTGIELVGGFGIHAGLDFRSDELAGLPLVTLRPGANWKEISKLRLSLDLWRWLSRHRPNTVFVPGYVGATALASALWAKLHRKRSVLMSESTQGDHPRTGAREWIKRTVIRLLYDWAVVGGKRHHDYLVELGFDPARIGSCYDVVDNNLFETGTDKLRSDTNAADHGFVSQFFLYVGRLAEEKNVMDLLSAFEEYQARGGDWHLVLAGDGPLRPALAAQIASAHLEKEVHLPGLKTARELLPFYAFAGCFVLPSTREPWGLVVNEAAAAGLPLIVSDRCGSSDELVVPNENGWVFNPAIPGRLAELLTAMASLSNGERLAMGERSRARVRQYSPECWAREVLQIVER